VGLKGNRTRLYINAGSHLAHYPAILVCMEVVVTEYASHSASMILIKLTALMWQVPWLIDETGEADLVLKKFIDLKLSLMPYIYSTAINTRKTGVAVMRPLFVEFPEDPFVWNVDTQYMLGSNLLVVPVFSAEGTVQYYVPKGDWYGILDEKIRTGPGFITETHDFFSLPLLLRPGAAIVLGKERAPGTGVRGKATYDYSEDITLVVNPVKGIDVLIEVPNSTKPGNISAILRAYDNGTDIRVDVVQGDLKGDWRIKKVGAGGISQVVVKDGVTSSKL
jgi:alpha-D-xyloside xylohydrolase